MSNKILNQRDRFSFNFKQLVLAGLITIVDQINYQYSNTGFRQKVFTLNSNKGEHLGEAYFTTQRTKNEDGTFNYETTYTFQDYYSFKKHTLDASAAMTLISKASRVPQGIQSLMTLLNNPKLSRSESKRLARRRYKADQAIANKTNPEQVVEIQSNGLQQAA